MPTENELKWLLKSSLKEEDVAQASKTYYDIQQGYLMASKGMSLRLRSRTEKKQKASETQYFMTYKCSVSGRVVEIEKKIDQRDFNDLWPQCMNKLIKVRYDFIHKEIRTPYDVISKCHPQTKWEIDFFKDHNNHNYFVMAEVELPEGVRSPSVVPKLISDNLVFAVPLTDCRFASKLLGDVRYAMELYKLIYEEEET